MTFWNASLIFIDKIIPRTTKLPLSFVPLYTYRKLYNNLKNLYKSIGWDWKYTEKNVIFKISTYMDEPAKVTNWDKYILNRDIIQVIIYDPNNYYYGLYTKQKDKIMEFNTIERIYKDIQVENITEPLLIYSINEVNERIKLIDVIDNPKRRYNKLVNRMIARGWL